MTLDDFTKEQRSYVGYLCFEAVMQERERCVNAVLADKPNDIGAVLRILQRIRDEVKS
jgi:hypothetical protein